MLKTPIKIRVVIEAIFFLLKIKAWCFPRQNRVKIIGKNKATNKLA